MEAPLVKVALALAGRVAFAVTVMVLSSIIVQRISGKSNKGSKARRKR